MPNNSDVQRSTHTEAGVDAIRRERTFRRGYHHGYEAALTNLSALLKEGRTPAEAVRLLGAHVDGVVLPWRSRARDGQKSSPPLLGQGSPHRTAPASDDDGNEEGDYDD